MSIFNELLPKLFDISKTSRKNQNDELEAAFASLAKCEEEYHSGRSNARDRLQKDKSRITTLQSINEDDGEAKKTPETAKAVDKPEEPQRRVSKKRSKDEVDGMSSPEQDKRSKRNASVKAQSNITKQDNEREILKDLDANGVAYVSTTKVNVNLTQKLRREEPDDKKGRGRKDDDKENSQPIIPLVQIKQEKLSIPLEPMDADGISLELNVAVKPEPRDDMPPPTKPVPKPRKGQQKEKEKPKETEETSEEEAGGRRRATRTRKQTDTMPPPPAPGSLTRASRASSRASSRAAKQSEVESLAGVEDTMPPPSPPPPPESRPKRTRAKKKVSEAATTDTEKSALLTDESAPASPAEKPRPKRTRRGKNAEKETQKAEEQTQSQKDEEKIGKDQEKIYKDQEKVDKDLGKTGKDQDKTIKDQDKTAKDQCKTTKDQENVVKDQVKTVKDKTKDQETSSVKSERISEPGSPVLQKSKQNNKKNARGEKARINAELKALNLQNETSQSSRKAHITIDDTITTQTTLNLTVTLNNDNNMDKTMVLPNGVYNHAPMTPKNIHVNETVVLERHVDQTMVLDRQNVNDTTVVIDKDPKPTNITEDNSLLTSDGDEEVPTTPPQPIPVQQSSSAVKEKVQQFEELAARTTRTKTRAMAKMQHKGSWLSVCSCQRQHTDFQPLPEGSCMFQEDNENHTPPDKIIKPVLSQETLNKMNNMIFNGKAPQVSTSASKPRAVPPKPAQPSSTSKLSALNKYREEKEREDARKKKEAMLEAKRELHKKKREEKMANAAAAREAAERERKLQMEALAKERMEKQLHADQGKLERLKEVERKKQELARKVAETEERRKAEEQARQQRLVEEQKKAELARKKQLEEAEASKKEAALMAKEIDKRQKEYMEKQKMKLALDKKNSPLRLAGTPGYYAPDPVYMADGFQYLNSDEDEADNPPARPVPAWSTAKHRKQTLAYQCQVAQVHIDTLFSVRIHSPDLREIFPNIDRARLKRTSSAVWRTPPRLPPLPSLQE